MRLIGKIAEETLAIQFQDVLIAEGIACSFEEDPEGFAVWVHDDDLVPRAREVLTEFQADPHAEKFREARQVASAKLRAAAAKRSEARRNTVRVSDQWREPTLANCPVTVCVLMLCVLVFVETDVLGDSREIRKLLLISTDGTWGAIRSGEWWRIFTPAIMHGGPLHIFFNLLWWWRLASLIEIRKGSFTLFWMTLAIAAFSNTLQFVMVGPWFLGLSGVVFGVFGYVWVKGKLDPRDGIGISDQSAMWMMVWFLICVMGMAGGIANWAHFGGLASGMTFGCASALWRTTLRRR